VYPGTHEGNICLKASLCQLKSSDQVLYLALSYRWPIVPEVEKWKVSVLKSSTLAILANGIPCSQLLPVYRDALTLTWHFGLEYIWIDALCILQDSKEDWAVQAQLMHKVYESAECMLFLDEPDEDGGFPIGRGSPPGTALELNWPTCRKWIIPRPKYFENAVEGSQLAARGWIYQERIFSRRILHFTKTELFWRCTSMVLSESGTSYSKKPGMMTGSLKLYLSDPTPRDRHILYFYWKGVITEFTSKDLTFQTDRLLAMAGIAAASSEKLTGDEYMAGAWSGCLTELLSWFVGTKAERKVYRGAEGTSRYTERKIEVEPF